MKRYVLIGAVVLTTCASPLLGAEMKLVPAGANMPHTIVGDEITVPAGARVELDVMLSDWRGMSGYTRLMYYEVPIRRDGSEFSGGTGGSLSFYRPGCTSDSQCETLLGEGTVCWPVDSLCTPSFINTSRADFVYFAAGSHMLSIGAGGTPDGLFWRVEAYYFPGREDHGPKYGGTFVVDVASDASGTFMVSLDPGPAWAYMLNLDGNQILPLNLVSARITIDNAVACSPDFDSDGDGIQDSVDDPVGVANFLDNATTPPTRGGITDAGDQDLCVSDAPGNYGVRAESLGTIGPGSSPASLNLICAVPTFDTNIGSVTTGNCITLTCRVVNAATVAEIQNFCSSSAAASSEAGGTSAAASDVVVELLAGGLVVGTVVLPVPNTVSWDPLTREVTAPGSNNTPLNVVTPSGDQLSLAPGGTVTLPPPAAIPAVSTWGLAALAIVLLAGAKIYFGSRRVAA